LVFVIELPVRVWVEVSISIIDGAVIAECLVTKARTLASLARETRFPSHLGSTRHFTGCFSFGGNFTIELILFTVEFPFVLLIKLVDRLLTFQNIKILLFKIFG
jgi:hypothetical protein